ncbi:MAG: Prolipoprotein diacylglyceryl transferase [uncultured Thermomicrobiales bacterium]|uniref:Phosphatidylglycerol--prolipoprotein diacylglyceryl transferase n=1 Tax=uncultured Thermomicrobiales bacterium TaxID=1645740 RepID=A0A6J4UXT8_9BACT|nr:MAG: Prolipoprotein diacylglyceryl transferase [uncultured Thermomicrobiales bacterium]
MPTLSDPVAFELLGLTIRWYALFILAGIAAAIWLIGKLAARRGFDPDFLLDIAPWVVVGSIAGARLTYVLLKWDYYGDHLGQAINLRLGGLSIHGATITGIVLVIWFCRRREQHFLAWADPMIAGLALGQAIGRWGNWANQEAFGTPTDLPWAVTIDPARRPAAYAGEATFHPTFLYESIFNLGNAALLAWVTLRIGRGRPFRAGDALWVYLITYGVGRFAIESIRTDSVYLGPYPGAYWASAAFIVVGVVVLLWRHRPGAAGSESGAGMPGDAAVAVTAAAPPCRDESHLSAATTSLPTPETMGARMTGPLPGGKGTDPHGQTRRVRR